MGKDVIIALDFKDKETTLKFLDQFQEKKPFVKVGMELFYSEGPEIIKEIKNRGHKIFLDLKLHDIPNTVEKAMRSVARLNVDMVNLHAAGGIKMMEAGLKGLNDNDSNYHPILIAVTQLTSTDQEVMEKEILIEKPLKEVVKQYALNAKKAGLQGVVCSPLEAGFIHQECGDGFVTVTPGVRFSDETNDDQKRITTPAKANELGSDYIVVGRPITQAQDPVEAYNYCVKEFVKE